MENDLVVFLWPIISGVIVVAIEHFVVVPLKNRFNSNDPIVIVTLPPIVERITIKVESNRELPLVIYQLLSMVFVSGLGGAISAILIRLVADNYYNNDLLSILTDLIANSNLAFIILVVVSMATGISVSLAAIYYFYDNAPFWLKIFTCIILGIFGGFAIWFVLIVLLFILTLVFIIKETFFPSGGVKEEKK